VSTSSLPSASGMPWCLADHVTTRPHADDHYAEALYARSRCHRDFSRRGWPFRSLREWRAWLRLLITHGSNRTRVPREPDFLWPLRLGRERFAGLVASRVSLVGVCRLGMAEVAVPAHRPPALRRGSLQKVGFRSRQHLSKCQRSPGEPPRRKAVVSTVGRSQTESGGGDYTRDCDAHHR
jgi:hypothetical protein